MDFVYLVGNKSKSDAEVAYVYFNLITPSKSEEFNFSTRA